MYSRSMRESVRSRGLALTLTLAFTAGFGVGCTTSKGVSEVDKELAKARKQAGKREAAECYPTNKEPCYVGADGATAAEDTINRGICLEGMRVCDDKGKWGACEGAVLPATELCNNIDDDCNGRVDDGFERDGTKCFAGEGECRTEGSYSCSADGSESTCSAKAKEPTAEVCDGKDNDCDGKIDDGDVDGTGDSCKTGQAGACAAGVKQCVAGAIKCMPTHVRTVEICNKIDDDCDNQVDEDCISEDEARKAGVIK